MGLRLVPSRNYKTRQSLCLRLLAVACVLLVIVAGTVQAVHVHPENSRFINHDCSICSVAHAGAAITFAYQPIPLLVSAPLVEQVASSLKPFLFVSSLYIRPPPSV